MGSSEQYKIKEVCKKEKGKRLPLVHCCYNRPLIVPRFGKKLLTSYLRLTCQIYPCPFGLYDSKNSYDYTGDCCAIVPKFTEGSQVAQVQSSYSKKVEQGLGLCCPPM